VFDPEKYRFDHHQRSFTNHWWEEKDREREEAAKAKAEENSKNGIEESKVEE